MFFSAPSEHYVLFSILMLLTVIRAIWNCEFGRCKRWKKILQLWTFHFIIVGMRNTEQITTFRTYTPATGNWIHFPKCGRSPWQLASYSKVEDTQKSTLWTLPLGWAEVEAPLHQSPMWRDISCPMLGRCNTTPLLWLWRPRISALGLPPLQMLVSW